MDQTVIKSKGFSPRQVCNLDGLIAHSEDAVVSRTLLNTTSGSLTLFSFDAGQKLSEHTCPYDAFVQVVEGSARVVIGTEGYDVEAGQLLLMPANVPHAVIATTAFKMLLTMFKALAS